MPQNHHHGPLVCQAWAARTVKRRMASREHRGQSTTELTSKNHYVTLMGASTGTEDHSIGLDIISKVTA